MIPAAHLLSQEIDPKGKQYEAIIKNRLSGLHSLVIIAYGQVYNESGAYVFPFEKLVIETCRFEGLYELLEFEEVPKIGYKGPLDDEY